MRSQYMRSLLLLLVMLTISACIRKDVSKYTTSLPHETVQDICKNFELDEDKSCQPDQIVYAPDFFPAILDHFSVNFVQPEPDSRKIAKNECLP